MYSISMLDGSCQTNSSSSLSLSRWRNSAAHRALSRGFPSFHIKVGGLVIAIKKVDVVWDLVFNDLLDNGKMKIENVG